MEFVQRAIFFYFRKKGEPSTFDERYLDKEPVEKGDLWVHTASFGEISPYLPYLRTLSSQKRVVITVTSGRTFSLVKDRFSSSGKVYLLPIEGSPRMKSMVDGISPKEVWVLEAEFWPSLFTALQKKGSVFTFLGARVRFPTTFLWRRWVKRGSSFLREIWTTPDCKKRFLSLGLSEEMIRTPFHPKILTPLPPEPDPQYREFTHLPSPRVVCGSFHREDLQFLLSADRYLSSRGVRPSYLIVPRYVGETEILRKMTEEQGERGTLYPQWSRFTFLNRMGVLPSLYCLGDVALIGGGWAKKGGHNPVEAVLSGKKAGIGPFSWNMKDLFPFLPKGLVSILFSPEDLFSFLTSSISEESFETFFQWREYWEKELIRLMKYVD